MLAWLAEEQAGGRAERSGTAFGWIGERGEAKRKAAPHLAGKAKRHSIWLESFFLAVASGNKHRPKHPNGEASNERASKQSALSRGPASKQPKTNYREAS
jgi:hypothetical protein